MDRFIGYDDILVGWHHRFVKCNDNTVECNERYAEWHERCVGCNDNLVECSDNSVKFNES